jgi:hypothetical protein
MRLTHHLQRSLFEENRRTPDIPSSVRSTLVRMIEGLLVEALADHVNVEKGQPTLETREAGHE